MMGTTLSRLENSIKKGGGGVQFIHEPQLICRPKFYITKNSIPPYSLNTPTYRFFWLLTRVGGYLKSMF